jgi:protoporphyrinogen oxidase
MTVIAILGSGMAAFGAGHAVHGAGRASLMFEKRSWHGGHTASYDMGDGFVFDEGPHVSFTKDERVRDLLAGSVNQEYEAFSAKVNNHWRGHWIKHPAQCNLHGLPTDLVVQVIKDFTDASHGPDDVEIANYAEWLRHSFGATFAETFPMEYTIKYHTTTADNMSTDWLGPRLYRPSLEEVLRGALEPTTEDVHYIAEVRYPSHGGFVRYLDRFLEETELHVDHEVVSVDPRGRRVSFASGSQAEYDRLISSVPLPELIPMIEGTPAEVLDAAARLACSTAVIVNLGINRPDIIDAHWTYFYDRDFFLTRLSTPHLQSPHNVPPGCGSVQAECYFSEKYRPLDREPDACIDPVIEDLRRCGLLREDDEIMHRSAFLIAYANVIFDLDRAGALAVVHGYLDELGIAYCGRYGDWGYLWTDESFLSGERAAERTLATLP